MKETITKCDVCKKILSSCEMDIKRIEKTIILGTTCGQKLGVPVELMVFGDLCSEHLEQAIKGFFYTIFPADRP